MKKVLIVSYDFPPMAAVGGQRVLNFCKFLPRFGWTPVVLTVKGGVNTSWDETPLKKIPETIIYRSATFEPMAWWELRHHGPRPTFKPKNENDKSGSAPPKLSLLGRLKRFIRLMLSVPDAGIFWVPLGLWKGLRAIRREKVSVIISSSPPVSAHILASLLARLTGLPHLVDFRDLWTLNHNYDQRGYPEYIRKYDASWERRVLRKAAGVMTASPGFTRQMQNHLGGMLQDKTVTITNGFDYEEIDLNREFPSMDKEKMRFLYTGTLYSYFNPVFFLESLPLWIKDAGIDRRTLQVDFYGNYDYDYTLWLKELELEGIVFFHGFIPRDQLLPIYHQADYLLLLLGFREQNRNVIPAKLFEYLASGARIFALAPEGVTTELIKKYEAGFSLSIPDKDAMKDLLGRIYKDWQKEPARKRKYRYIEDIDRAKLTGRLAEILETMAAARGK